MSKLSTVSPKISVLIPAWNGEAYIGEAIQSVLDQTYTDFELIISDDCSTDKTAAIAASYEQKDRRVRFVQQPKNLGCNKNINWLLLAARGTYLKILIHDDMLHESYLKECVHVLDAHPTVGLVTSYQKFIGNWHTYRNESTIPFSGEQDGRVMQRHLLIHRNWIGGETATMFRRDGLVEGLWNTEWGWIVDGDAWMRILRRHNLYIIPKVLSYPRMHEKQGTAYLNKGFSFVQEELDHLQVVGYFPDLYGRYSQQEITELVHQKFLRVLEEWRTGITKGSAVSLIQLGWKHTGIAFFFIVISYYSRFLIQRTK